MLRERAPPNGLASVFVVVLCVLSAGFFVTPSAYGATPTLVGSFTGSDTPAGSLGMTNATHLAVDEATGDVYVTDPSHDVIDRFDSTGSYLSQISGSSTAAGTFSLGDPNDDIAVDNSGGPNQGGVYVMAPNSGTLFALDSSGVERWEAISPDASWCGVSVDPSGNPWIGDYAVTALTQLSPSDGSATGTSITTSGTYCHFGFDSQGTVYAAKFGGGGVDKYDQTGGTLSIESNSIVYGIGTSFARNTFFAAEADLNPPPTPTVRQFDQGGTRISRLDGALGSHFAHGVAFNGRSDLLYVSDDTAGTVYIYSVPPQSPTVTPIPVTNITSTGGTVNGTVNPNGSDVTDCHVDYETDAQFSSDGNDFVNFTSVPCSQTLPLTGATDQAVSADLTGLTPSTTYHTRIVATNAGGTTNGSDVLLTTLPAPAPVVVTGAASSVGETGATLAGTVNPNGFNVTDCHIDYGTSTSYGSSVPCSSSPGSGSSAVGVSGAVTGLSAGTTYHFRVVATNAGGTTNGSDATFTTQSRTCADDSSLCPPPQRRCPGDLTLCHPHLHLNGGGSWVGSNWFLRVKCSDDLGGTCAGKLTLKAVIKVKVKRGHKTVVKKKTITVGTASYSLAVGGTARLKVKLASAAKSALKKGGLTATVISSVDGKLGSAKIARLKARAKHKRK